MTGPGPIVRTQSHTSSLASDLSPVVPVSEAKVPAVVVNSPRRVSKRLRRLVRPYWIATGIACAALGGSFTLALEAGVLASAPSEKAVKVATAKATKAERDAHLAAVRSAYERVSISDMRAMKQQADAARKNLDIMFAIEPLPLSAPPDEAKLDRYKVLDSEAIARTLALHGRVYAGIVRTGPVIEQSSAKAITSIDELQRYLAEVGR
ncbi:MAG: hypothetical protein ACAI38_11280 [Myxococcota bacterium]